MIDNPAAYSRAYQSVCGNGCGSASKLARAYNKNCAQSACSQNLCAQATGNREGFTTTPGLASMPPADGCGYTGPYDYTNHLATNQGGGPNVSVGASGGGAPFCNILDASVNEYQLPFAAIGWSALANAYSYLPSTGLRMSDTNALTNRGRRSADFNQQYAKQGTQNQQLDQFSRVC